MIDLMWNILLELAPWLLIGVGVAGLLHVALPEDFMRRHLSGRWGVVKAAALGAPLPLCSCAVIPVGLSLRQQGASQGASLAFLISTPQTGVDSILVSAGMLGWPFALFKMASAFVIGLVGGAAADVLARGPDGAVVNLPACESRPAGSGWERFSEHVLMLLRTIWHWLALGIAASAAITYLIPPDSLARLGAGGGMGAMLLALVIGMPLYVCAVASVPIAAALVHGGLPASAALVFLIAGPASNVATMGAVYRSLGRRAFAVYVGSIAIGSLAAGWAFESALNLDALHGLTHNHQGHDFSTPWAAGSAIALLLLMGWFALQEIGQFLRKRGRAGKGPAPRMEGASQAAGGSIDVGVAGMSCQSCVSRLEAALSRAPGVADASVTLKPGRATVRGQITRERVCEIIEGAGFQAV